MMQLGEPLGVFSNGGNFAECSNFFLCKSIDRPTKMNERYWGFFMMAKEAAGQLPTEKT
jgi:hypothetical protein